VILHRDGVRLACTDFGGAGPSALLLHGLAGDAQEWDETAEWLSERCRVLALDARGHGDSERRPDDVSTAACVADVVFAIEQLQLAPVILIGQSLGGVTAMLVAAERPELMRALIVADASPAAGDDAAVEEVANALPAYGGANPSFELDVMVRMLRASVGEDHWAEWERIACPTLVVRAGDGMVAPAEGRRMAKRAQLVEIPDAGHDLHLDRPAEWRAAVEEFLSRLSDTPAGPA
jgi:pimeloyl-ACP methyl ester carboxylesterase